MTKRLLYTICFIFCASFMNAQTMEWLSEPQYDKIEVLNDNLYLVSSDGKYGILDNYGKLLYGLKYDKVTPFQEGRALLLCRGKSGYMELAVLLDESGRMVRNFEGKGYLASFDYPYYKEGKMVYVSVGKKGYMFGYLDQSGYELIPAKFIYAAPFINGKAIVRMEQGVFGVINSAGSPAVFSDKPFYFLSSIVDGRALGWRHSRNGGEMVQVKLNGEAFVVEKVLAEGYGELNFPNDNYSQVSFGSHRFNFDAALRYVGNNAVEERTPIALPRLPKDGSSCLSATRTGTLYGVAFNGEQILLPQFANVTPMREHVVSAATTSAKIGLLYVNENASVTLLEKSKNFELRSGSQPELFWEINLNGVKPEQVSVRLKSESTGSETTLSCVTDAKGYRKISMPFEFKSQHYNQTQTQRYKAIVSINGMEAYIDALEVSYAYQNFLRNVVVSAPKYTEMSGYADVKVEVYTYEPLTSEGKATISLSSGEKKIVGLNGRTSASVTFKVFVSEEKTSTFKFNITVTDGKGCPSASTSKSCTISNYYLQ